MSNTFNTLLAAAFIISLSPSGVAAEHDLAPDTSTAQSEDVWQGTVDALNVKEGMILVNDRTFYFTTGTVITRGNKPAAVTDIHVGGDVRAIQQLPLPYNRAPHLTQIQILK